MRALADIIDNDIIGSDNPMPEEVSQVLLYMMRRRGTDGDIILNHVSLVPIENRLDLNLRMCQHMYNTIAKLSKLDRAWAQSAFLENWHTQTQVRTTGSTMTGSNGRGSQCWCAIRRCYSWSSSCGLGFAATLAPWTEERPIKTLRL